MSFALFQNNTFANPYFCRCILLPIKPTRKLHIYIYIMYRILFFIFLLVILFIKRTVALGHYLEKKKTPYNLHMSWKHPLKQYYIINPLPYTVKVYFFPMLLITTKLECLIVNVANALKSNTNAINGNIIISNC